MKKRHVDDKVRVGHLACVFGCGHVSWIRSFMNEHEATCSMRPLDLFDAPKEPDAKTN